MTSSIEPLINVADLSYLVVCIVRDVLWLRILTVAGTVRLMPFHYFSEPSMAALYRNLLFTVLTLYWILRLLIERAPKKLTADQRRFYEPVLRTMSSREMVRLPKSATWCRKLMISERG